MTVLITGATGKLGGELKKIFPKPLTPGRETLDITNKKSVAEYIKGCNPTQVIHTAALTDVRLCEKVNKLAWLTNVVGTKNLVEACEKANPQVYFVYISTACVFSGEGTYYSENDIPHPKNFYALTKLIAEIIVGESVLKNWLVIRTNFVTKSAWPYPKAFKDRFGTYLYTEDAAKAIKEAMNEKLTGIVHICGKEKMSMYDLAKKTTPDIKPMTLNEYKGPPLTVDMSLTTARWKKYKISNP